MADRSVLKAWLRRRRSLVVTSTSGVVIAAIIAGVAIVSGGYTAQKLELGDGSVWVSNGARQVIGRANMQIERLDTVVQSEGTEIDVVQDGSTVLLVDQTNSRADVIDVATASVGESVPLPVDAPAVMLAGENSVVFSGGSGAMWILPTAELASFDAQAEPTLSLGADAVAAAGPDGTVVVYSADARQVYRVEASSSVEVADSAEVDLGDADDDITATVVGDQWVLYDRQSRELQIGTRTISLASELDDGDTAMLQQPSDDGSAVLVAVPDGLLSVSLTGGIVERLTTVDPGSAVAPLVWNGCRYAAWSSGEAWRSCTPTGGDGTTLALDGVPASSTRLEFRANGQEVVLNDPASGGTWAVRADGALIANWDELIVQDEDQEELEQSDEDTPPEYQQEQAPPVAVDDRFGARPGRTTVLPVLLNDYDVNGDVLVVAGFDAVDEQVGSLQVINQGQQIQLALAETAVGTVTFGYTISDGRGGTAAASVTVTVRGTDENSAPQQVRQTRALVAEGARVTSQVLGDWIDPDGDAFYLASASVGAPDTVSYKPEGTVVFQEGGAGSELRSVAVVVSDGTAQGVGSLAVTVRAAGQVPIIADPFPVQAYAGQEVTVSPLEHVRGGTGTIRLSSVAQAVGATIDVSLERGTFRFSSDQPRTYYLDYVVNDGDQTATGVVRVDVTAPPDAGSTPITTPKNLFVRTLSSATIDVAASDIDPAGGVLLVSSAGPVPTGANLRVDVLDQRAVRVTLTGPLDAGPVTFGYRITNGIASADGVITVIEVPPPARLQPPIAEDDTVTVRVGDAIDIPVLANDSQPDGEEITLSTTLPTPLRAASGLLFASGTVLRYLAPEQTGNFTAVYEISGPDGQIDQAEVTIAVREAVDATNAAPVTRRITARVFAGETVRVPIPLSGIDPDGDSVQLIGQATNPEKGSVTETGPDYVDYLAGDYSAGTDVFTYVVVDALGARATGTVRIGISPRGQDARNPIAVDDEVTVRPGTTVSVQALVNDSDPDGGELSVTAVESNADPDSTAFSAEIVDDVVRVTPPEEPGRYGLVYTISNDFGGSAQAFITVIVDPDAPLAVPVARDTVLTLADIVDREEVSVDVRRNVFFADGEVSTLGISLLDGYQGTATVTAGGRIRVDVASTRQIIPFAVSRPDDPSIVAYAFVWVPGSDDALPQLDRTAQAISVASESTVTIDLNDYVIAVNGRTVRLADATSVAATHADGADLVVDATTLRFTSADRYFGPASISFEVTDGTSASDPEGRRATLVLPITVTPRQNQPPVFLGGSIDFEPGAERTVDLTRLTTYPYPDDLDELVYNVINPLPTGFTYRLVGTQLTITARDDAVKNTSTAISVAVGDALAAGQSGRIRLNVVASTRPLARPAPDQVIAPRGQTTVFDVLQNDTATNPFPGSALRVVAIRGLEGAALPAGVAVSPSADNSRLSVTIDPAALPGDVNLQYQVADSTGDSDRYVWGSVRISVQDRPDAPVAPARAGGGYEEGLLTLRLTAPPSNNSAITGYTVMSTSNGAYRKDCGLVLRCVLTDLTPGAVYQFTVTATNAIGASDASASSVSLSADYLPSAPTAVSVRAAAQNGTPALAISWATVPDPDPGSSVAGYTVSVSGPGVDFSTDRGRSEDSITTTAGGGLDAGSNYTVTVYAKNQAFVLSAADWRRTTSSPTTAVGYPGSPAGGVSAALIGTTGQIQVSWGRSDSAGAPGVTYDVARFDAGAALPTACSASGGNSGVVSDDTTSGWVDEDAADGGQYRYVVYARNGLFCTATASSAVESKRAPGAVTGAATELVAHGAQLDVRASGSFAASGIVDRFEARVGSGQWRTVVSGDWLTSIGLGTTYGAPVTVAFRACRDVSQSLCGPVADAAASTPLNAQSEPISPVQGVVPQFTRPVNPGAIVTVSHRVTYLLLGLPVYGEYGAVGADEPVPSGATSMRVETSVTLGATTHVYDDPTEWPVAAASDPDAG